MHCFMGIWANAENTHSGIHFNKFPGRKIAFSNRTEIQLSNVWDLLNVSLQSNFG